MLAGSRQTSSHHADHTWAPSGVFPLRHAVVACTCLVKHYLPKSIAAGQTCKQKFEGLPDCIHPGFWWVFSQPFDPIISTRFDP